MEPDEVGRARATHHLDTIDAVTAELDYWLHTGQYTGCARCFQRVPAAAADGTPVRHRQLRLGQPETWCEGAQDDPPTA